MYILQIICEFLKKSRHFLTNKFYEWTNIYQPQWTKQVCTQTRTAKQIRANALLQPNKYIYCCLNLRPMRTPAAVAPVEFIACKSAREGRRVIVALVCGGCGSRSQ